MCSGKNLNCKKLDNFFYSKLKENQILFDFLFLYDYKNQLIIKT